MRARCAAGPLGTSNKGYSAREANTHLLWLLGADGGPDASTLSVSSARGQQRRSRRTRLMNSCTPACAELFTGAERAAWFATGFGKGAQNASERRKMGSPRTRATRNILCQHCFRAIRDRIARCCQSLCPPRSPKNEWLPVTGFLRGFGSLNARLRRYADSQWRSSFHHSGRADNPFQGCWSRTAVP